MEFSFGPHKWLPKESLVEGRDDSYALGLHAPGYFDKILNVDKCLLQTDPANKVCNFILVSGLEVFIVSNLVCNSTYLLWNKYFKTL